MLNNAQVTYVNENGGNDLPDNWFEDITGWIGDLLANPLWSFLDWFTQAEWVSEVGELANDSCTPGTGILGELERRVGQTFPDLRAKQQAVVDAWRTFQRAWPWDKASTAEAYETQVKVFLAAVKAQIEQLEELPAVSYTHLTLPTKA